MRVTLVLPFVNLTGGIRMVLDYANYLHDAGHDVRVVYPLWPYRFHWTRRQQLQVFRDELRRVPHVPWLSLRARLVRVPVVAGPFVPRADVIVATSWPTAHDVARLPASCGRKVHLVMHHESGTGPEGAVRAVHRLPFFRIAISEAVRQELRARFDCAIERVVPPPIDAATFFPDISQAGDGVLTVYHPDPRKGWDTALAAIDIVRRRQPGSRFQAFGTLAPSSLPPWLGYHHAPGDARLRGLYANASVFLYPSRYEGFGLPPLEAMACGCPVVTTRVGGVPEFCEDRANALVCDPGDADALAAGVEELMADAELRARLTANGVATAGRFSLPQLGPVFEAALRGAR
jgi:glycosyltransferase involved in cell wall biosynthesis